MSRPLGSKNRKQPSPTVKQQRLQKETRRKVDWQRRHRALDPEKTKAYHRDKHLQRTYKITLERWKVILEGQDGRCPICLRPEWTYLTKNRYGAFPRTAFVVDHDHNTQTIRGILCNDCNRTLGFMREDCEALTRMIAYLKVEANAERKNETRAAKEPGS